MSALIFLPATMTYTDILSRTFKTHFQIEFLCRSDRLLSENVNIRQRILDESYGLFNKCEALAKEVLRRLTFVDALGLCENENGITFQIEEEGFVKNIKLTLERNSNGGAYIPNESVVKNGIFEPLSICLGLGCLKNNRAFIVLCHELTHAYEDLMLQRRGMSIGKRAEAAGYYLTANGLFDENALKQNICRMLYYLGHDEFIAYMASLKAEMMQNTQTFRSVEDAYRFLKSTSLYKMYEKTLKDAERLTHIKDIQVRRMVLDVVKQNSGYNFKSYRQFCGWLKRNVFSFDRKIKSIVPKMAADILNVRQYGMFPTQGTWI